MDLLDSTITTIAAPTISSSLHGGPGLIKWLGASYALALGVLLVTGGRLGDKYGRRRTFLIGIAGFTAASLACGLAWDPPSIIVARLVQGAFGGAAAPAGLRHPGLGLPARAHRQGVQRLRPGPGAVGCRRSAAGRPADRRQPVRAGLAAYVPDQHRAGRGRAGRRAQATAARRRRPRGAHRRPGLGAARGVHAGPAVRPDPGVHRRVDCRAGRRPGRRGDLLRRLRPAPADRGGAADQAVAAAQPGLHRRAHPRPGLLRRRGRAALRGLAVPAAGPATARSGPR